MASDTQKAMRLGSMNSYTFTFTFFTSKPEINLSSHAKNLNNLDFYIYNCIAIPDFTILSCIIEN